MLLWGRHRVGLAQHFLLFLSDPAPAGCVRSLCRAGCSAESPREGQGAHRSRVGPWRAGLSLWEPCLWLLWQLFSSHKWQGPRILPLGKFTSGSKTSRTCCSCVPLELTPLWSGECWAQCCSCSVPLQRALFPALRLPKLCLHTGKSLCCTGRIAGGNCPCYSPVAKLGRSWLW